MSILKEIIANKEKEVEKRKAFRSFEALENKLKYVSKGLPCFKTAIKRKDEIKFITEIKKGSPSRGVILEDANVTEIAKTYEQCGAAAISVLTDKKYFLGSLSVLNDVTDVVKIPCVCKDFIIDEYQLYEAKYYKASATLLIVKALSSRKIKHFLQKAKEIDLDCIVEIHDEMDLRKIEGLDVEIVGVNNRSLETMQIDIQTSLHLKKYLGKDMIKISESGIETREDVLLMQDAGYDALLVGSSLMASKDIKAKLLGLMGK